VIARRIVALAAAIACLVACAAPPSSDPRFVATLPDRASFPPVAALLEHSCGSLDCHGTVSRNLKTYGNTGLRLGPGNLPSALTATTDAEIDQDYESLVGLEPEVMSAVVAAHGASPERLTFVRKARGAESHKGGVLMQAGDDSDACITSWLTGTTDAAACARAVAAP
jgi:hypothetical protein